MYLIWTISLDNGVFTTLNSLRDSGTGAKCILFSKNIRSIKLILYEIVRILLTRTEVIVWSA